MFRKTITIIVLACFLFYTGCASVIQKVPVKETEYDDIKIAKKIYVTTKGGIEHEIIQFEYTETLLIGEELLPNGKTKPIEINLSYIDYIKVIGVLDYKGEIITNEEIKMNITTNYRIPMAIIGGIVPGVLVFWFFCAYTDFGDVIGTFLIGETIINAFGALLGYMVGNNLDKKKAIDKIEKEREQEKEKDSKEDKQD